MSTAIHWFRRDLRLIDNPALAHALREADEVLLIYIHAPEEEAPWQPGAASRWWLHESLQALAQEIAAHGGQLILRQGPALAVLQALLQETGADLVTWNRLYEPAIIARDRQIKSSLREMGCTVRSFRANLLHEPWEIATGGGTPYRVFTPFWKSARADMPALEPIHASLPRPARHMDSASAGDLGLLDTPSWWRKLAEHWQPGSQAAVMRLETFAEEHLDSYDRERDRPDHPGTSRLSPHLHFGEISPTQIWAALSQSPPTVSSERFAAELGWREFAHHLLYHFPDTPERNLNPRFDRFPWREDGAQDLEAWQQGRTGIDFVDAALRELWETGWMHNRMRMLVGSLLTKNLRLHWQHGARWFWDTLVDADLASNTLGWQWIAGCGADAAPYFRIFNPDTQAEKFDPAGDYRRHWLGERERPQPIVDLQASRRAALDAWQQIRATPADAG